MSLGNILANSNKVKSLFYARYPRNRFLVELINISVMREEYQIAYEVVKGFRGDILKMKVRPIFKELFTNLSNVMRYEAKLELCISMIPFM